MDNQRHGARFLDENKQDRGWASDVVRRGKTLGRLVFLEVTTSDRELSSFLGALDKSPIQVEPAGPDGVSYRFTWASGYRNGNTIRVQGVLQDP